MALKALKGSSGASARRAAAALAVLALAGVVLAGCGSSSSSSGSPGSGGTKVGGQTAAAFIREITNQFALGQSGRLWDTLHPGDQAVVSRARYVACQTNAGFEEQSFKVLDSYVESVDIGGVSTPSTAVSIRVVADDGVTTATMHAVSLGGSWRWILSPADHAAYKRGSCPASASNGGK